MTSATPRSFAIAGPAGSQTPPRRASGRLETIRNRLFPTISAGIATIVLALLVGWALWGVLRWGLIDAVWYAPEGAACRATNGACWAVIAEKYRVILFGVFPYDEQWRGGTIIALWVLWSGLSATRLFSLRNRLAGWLIVFVVSLLLMKGGVLGLHPVSADLWGGLPLTFVIFGGTLVAGLPLAVLLALGRRSSLPILRGLCIATIEGMRGFPLLVVLFFAALILPLFLPPQLAVDKLVRAEIGMIIFFAAYAAEVVRGGLQALPEGQDEAAKALGLGYWRRMRLVILPQALAIAVPALFNDIIRAFKNTTFFSILGLFDVLGATKAALDDPNWVRFGMEGYLFVFLLYFVICSSLSLYGRSIERDAERRVRRAGQ